MNEIEAALTRFEAAWRNGESPQISEFLTDGDNQRDILLELVAIDLEFRWRQVADQAADVQFAETIVPGASVTPVAPANSNNTQELPSLPVLEDYVACFVDLGTPTSLPPDVLAHEYYVRSKWGDRPSSDSYQIRFPEQHAAFCDAIEEFADELTAIHQGNADDTAAGEADVADTLPPSDVSVKPATDRPQIIQPPETISAFMDRLEQEELLSTAQLAVFRTSASNVFDPSLSATEALAIAASEIVERKLLTEFQVTTILNGGSQRLVLGEYVITDELGQGGMGQVYRAVHRRMNRTVALKVLCSDLLGNADAIKRFRREVETVSRLDHPNIVTAHDADAVDGMHFYVMELVTGNDLSDHVKLHGPTSVRQAVDCMLQAARGLEYTHSEGVIHRDIKPHNLLLDGDGTVKILDLGLARLERREGEATGDGLTGTGTMMGTVDYMAPEQALDSRRADARSDIYSLGCTLFFMLTGRPLFDGDTFMKKLLAHRSDTAPSLREACPAVTDELHAVYERMVAKAPDDRLQTMTDLIVALESCVEGLPAVDQPGLAHIATDLIEPTVTLASPAQRKLGNKLKEVLAGRAVRIIGLLCILGVVIGVGYAIVSPLLPPQGTLVLDLQQADLAGAIVTLDGEPAATIPEGSEIQVVAISADGVEHTLEITRDGSKPFSQTITFDEAETRLLPVELIGSDTPPPNYAVKFHGKGTYVEFPTLKFAGYEQLTVELIVVPGIENNGIAVVNSYDGTNGFGLAVWSSQFRFGVGDTGTNKASRLHFVHAEVRSMERTVADRPCHIAMVLNGKVQRLFVNGILQGTQLLEEPNLGTVPLKLNGGLYGIFDGVTDELRVSRTARYQDDFLPTAYLSNDDHTVALYHFDEGTGSVVHDASGNGHDGKIVGAEWVKVADVGTEGDIASLIQQRRAERAAIPEWAQNPQYNNALQFDGDGDFLEVPTLLLGDTRPFTFEAWINPDDAAQTGTVFSTTCTVRKPAQGLKLALDGGNVTGLVHGTDSQGNAFTSEIKSSSRSAKTLANQQDTHVAFCFDGESQHLYLNGQLIDSRRVLGARPSSELLHIGADTNGRDYGDHTFSCFTGRMDEVRISCGQRYTDSFTPERRLKSDETTLALYHCDEGAGDYAHDHSGNGHHARLINARWIRRAGDASPLTGPLIARAPFDPDEAQSLQESWAEFLGIPINYENSLGMKFCLIPPGEFFTGSTEAERIAATDGATFFRSRYDDEFLQHRVGVLMPLYLGQFEVTQAQYQEIAGTNPSAFSSGGQEKSQVKGLTTLQHPVETVSPDESLKFCFSLTSREGLNTQSAAVRKDNASATVTRNGYRLPTEDEWEYACRAGSTGWFSFGSDVEQLDDHAWQARNSDSQTHIVGTLRPNGFGLFDMHENVAEQCFKTFNTDAITPPIRVAPLEFADNPRIVAKGGAWSTHWTSCRCAVRWVNAASRSRHNGFRVALPITPETVTAIRRSISLDQAIQAARTGEYDLNKAFELDAALPKQSPGYQLQLARLLALCAGSSVSDSEPDSTTSTKAINRAVQILETLDDQGQIDADDLTHTDFASLERSPRFLLLRKRPEQFGNVLVRRRAIRERHWRTIGTEYLPPDATKPWTDLATDRNHASCVYAALALLNGNREAFETHCQEVVLVTPWGLQRFGVLADNRSTDNRVLLQSLRKTYEKDPQPWHLYRIAYLHYRLGEWREAIQAAEESQKTLWGAHVMNHVVTAMAMHQLGQQSEAREYYVQRMMDFDSQPIGPDARLHIVDTVTLPVVRREAEDLIFGHSDSREMDEIMSQARAGEVAEALERLKPFEERIETLSPRFRYFMARSYSQCWSHLQNDTNASDEEKARLSKRATDLMQQLHNEEHLDPASAHLAIDFRPLIDEPQFLTFCRQLDPDFDAAMKKPGVFRDVARLLNSDDEVLQKNSISQSLKSLEALADRGSLTPEDLQYPGFLELEMEPRFLLLRERIAQTGNYIVRRHELRERHWRQLADEFVVQGGEPSELVRENDPQISVAAIALLEGDKATFEAACERIVTTPNDLFISAMALNPHANYEAMLEKMNRLNAKAAGPWNLYRIACLYYYLGKWQESIDAAQKSLQLDSAWDHALNHVVIAMAMYQLGQTDEARIFLTEKLKSYDNVVQQFGDAPLHYIDLLALAIWRREAEDLILGHSDSREMDEIMSQARAGEVAETLKRLESFEERIETLSPRFRYYMARSYAQCWSHLREESETSDDEKARLSRRATDLLQRLHDQGHLGPPNNAHLAIDLRPLVSEPGFISLCRRMDSTFDTAMVINEASRQSAAGKHAAASELAIQLLSGDALLSVRQRRQLMAFIAKHSTSTASPEVAASEVTVTDSKRALATQLLWLVDHGFLAESDLSGWTTQAPWLAENDGRYESLLATRIRDNREQQIRLIGEVLAMGGDVQIQKYGGATGDEQWALREHTILQSHSEVPDEPFAVWGVRIIDQSRLNDEALRELVTNVGKVPSLRHVRLQNVNLSPEGILLVQGFGDSITRLGFQKNPWFDGEAMSHLGSFPGLEHLMLDNAPISDADLKHLETLTQMGYLGLANTTLSDEAIESLQQALPDCRINR
jgi:formylglycine-generating enzyme required for sulfatase activity/tetratricopeptide (TPR) repeat protein